MAQDEIDRSSDALVLQHLGAAVMFVGRNCRVLCKAKS
jgi:hypothetical protein